MNDVNIVKCLLQWWTYTGSQVQVIVMPVNTDIHKCVPLFLRWKFLFSVLTCGWLQLSSLSCVMDGWTTLPAELRMHDEIWFMSEACRWYRTCCACWCGDSPWWNILLQTPCDNAHSMYYHSAVQSMRCHANFCSRCLISVCWQWCFYGGWWWGERGKSYFKPNIARSSNKTMLFMGYISVGRMVASQLALFVLSSNWFLIFFVPLDIWSSNY